MVATLSSRFENSQNGKDLIGVMRLVASLAIILSIFTFGLVRYWSSLVTNRVLLSGLLKIYVAICFCKFIIVLAAVIVVFETFGEVERWGVGVDPLINQMFPLHMHGTLSSPLPYLHLPVWP